MRWWLGLWVVAGCGRIAFDPVGDGGGSAAARCPSFALFCDDFESGDLTAWDDMDLSPGGTLVASRAHVHTGSFALDATMPMQANGASAALIHRFPAISSGMLAVREWIYTLEPLDNYNGPMNLLDVPNHYALIAGAGPDWVISENSPGNGIVNHFGTPVPPGDRWTCIELDVTFSPPRMELFVNDTLNVGMAATDPSPLYRQLWAGVTRADIAGFRVFVDDVVRADRHIGCQ